MTGRRQKPAPPFLWFLAATLGVVLINAYVDTRPLLRAQRWMFTNLVTYFVIAACSCMGVQLKRVGMPPGAWRVALRGALTGLGIAFAAASAVCLPYASKMFATLEAGIAVDHAGVLVALTVVLALELIALGSLNALLNASMACLASQLHRAGPQ